MSGSLDGKTAVVTGASSGIGAATARALAEAGATVVLGARREDRLAELAREIEGSGGQAKPVRLDVADETSVHELFDALDRVDILINNAGLMLLGPVEGADTEDWRRMVDVNILGVLYCTHAALPMMRATGGGHIVNLSSVAGRVTNPANAVYALTKFGVGAFSDSLRQAYAGSGIRVTVVEPGFVETELQGHNRPEVQQGIEQYREQVGEVLKAEDIARAIVYAVTQPPHVSVNELLVRPSGQAR